MPRKKNHEQKASAPTGRSEDENESTGISMPLIIGIITISILCLVTSVVLLGG